MQVKLFDDDWMPVQPGFDARDVCANRHKGNPQSKQANLAVAPHKESIRARILSYVREQGEAGATSYEIELALNLRHQTCAARLAELKRDGLVVPTGKTRATDSGCQAMALRAAMQEVV